MFSIYMTYMTFCGNGLHFCLCIYSDPSQSDPDSKDFWFNMQALTVHLQREAELNPQASYYNVALLKYQVTHHKP